MPTGRRASEAVSSSSSSSLSVAHYMLWYYYSSWIPTVASFGSRERDVKLFVSFVLDTLFRGNPDDCVAWWLDGTLR